MIEEQKIPYDKQEELAYKFLDILATKFVGYPDYKSMKGGNMDKDYLAYISKGSYGDSKNYYENVTTVTGKFLIELQLFSFDHYRTFMESIEMLFKDFKDLRFNLDPDAVNEQIFVQITIDKFYDKLIDENDNTFRSLLGLNKFNL